MPQEPISALRFVVRGRVQGVGFRWACRRTAQALGVSGWVRNRSDGAVEGVISGPPEALARMVEWLRQGPPGARVDALDTRPAEPVLGDFAIRR